MDLRELENVIIGEEILFSWLGLWRELSKGLGSERKVTVFGNVTGAMLLFLTLSWSLGLYPLL